MTFDPVKSVILGVCLVCSTIGLADNKIIVSYDQKAILAIIGEAENQGVKGMEAVAYAIRNRGTLKGVYGLNAPRVKNNLYTKATWLQAQKAWKASASGQDITNGANAWENLNAFGKPYWADSCQETVTIKDHIFFKCPTT